MWIEEGEYYGTDNTPEYVFRVGENQDRQRHAQRGIEAITDRLGCKGTQRSVVRQIYEAGPTCIVVRLAPVAIRSVLRPAGAYVACSRGARRCPQPLDAHGSFYFLTKDKDMFLVRNNLGGCGGRVGCGWVGVWKH